MGDPGPVVELHGEGGAGPELGSTEDVSRDHAAEGLLTIWLEEPAPPVIQRRPPSALWQLVSRRLEGRAQGVRGAEARRTLPSASCPLLVSFSILLLTLPATLPVLS